MVTLPKDTDSLSQLLSLNQYSKLNFFQHDTVWGREGRVGCCGNFPRQIKSLMNNVLLLTRLTPTLWGKINNEAWLMIHLMFLYGYIMIKIKIKVLFWHYNLKKRKERKSVPNFNSFIRNNTYSQFSILLLLLLSARKSYTAISGIPSNKVCYETYI